MRKKYNRNQIAIYQLENGAIQLKTDGKGNTLWASLSQMLNYLIQTSREYLGISIRYMSQKSFLEVQLLQNMQQFKLKEIVKFYEKSSIST